MNNSCHSGHVESMQVTRLRAANGEWSDVGGPWTTKWTRWDPAAVDRDFGLAAGLGANAVRIIAHPDAFGYPVPAPARTAQLARAVASLAGSVPVTLLVSGMDPLNDLVRLKWTCISAPCSGGHDHPGSVVVRHPGADGTSTAELTVTPVVQTVGGR